MHLTAAQGWLELGNHEEAFEELEQIDAPLRGHPDVLDIRWDIYCAAEKWDCCVESGDALMRMTPERLSGWIQRSSMLCTALKCTQEAYDQLKPALEQFNEVELPWYNLACYACVLGNKEEARELLDKAIELGGDYVKLQALKDEDLLGMWGGRGSRYFFSATTSEILSSLSYVT